MKRILLLCLVVMVLSALNVELIATKVQPARSPALAPRVAPRGSPALNMKDTDGSVEERILRAAGPPAAPGTSDIRTRADAETDVTDALDRLQQVQTLACTT